MQEILEKYPDLRFEPPGRSLSSQVSRDASDSSSLPSALGGTIGRVARGFRRDRDPEIGESAPVSEPWQLEGTAEGAATQQARSSQRSLDKRRRFFLLYLNHETWLGAAGSKLADQVCASPPHGSRTSATPATRSSPPQTAANGRASCTPSRCAPRAPRASA